MSRTLTLFSWRRLLRPASVLVASTAGVNVLRILSAVVLTRLLSPSAYGLVGIIMSIFFVIVMLTDTGLQVFVVRHVRGLERDFLDAVWTVHLLRGLVMTAIATALALPLAWVLDKPQLAPLLAVASISMTIDGAASLSIITALRRNMVRKLSLLDLSVAAIQVMVSIVAALALRSVWAIIIAIIAASLARTIASYLLFPHARQRLRFDRTINAELWSFSRVIAASSTLTLLLAQFDRLVLAKLFTLQQFGIYSVAGGLVASASTLVHLYTARILFPAVAETHRVAPDRVRDKYYGMRGTAFYGFLFASGGLIGAASLVVTILYDPRYYGATFYLRLLAITPALFMLTKSMNDLLVARGDVRATLEMNVARVVWLVVAALAGYFALGALGVVLAVALIELPAYVFGAIKLSRANLYSLRDEAMALATVLAGVGIGLLAAIVVPAIVPVS